MNRITLLPAPSGWFRCFMACLSDACGYHPRRVLRHLSRIGLVFRPIRGLLSPRTVGLLDERGSDGRGNSRGAPRNNAHLVRPHTGMSGRPLDLEGDDTGMP